MMVILDIACSNEVLDLRLEISVGDAAPDDDPRSGVMAFLRRRSPFPARSPGQTDGSDTDPETMP